MHDGYVYTFGLCTAVDGPAAALLNRLLAALPPVKRAAFLADSTAEFLPALTDELRDAELLLFVLTPGDDDGFGWTVVEHVVHGAINTAHGAALVIGVGAHDPAQLDAPAALLRSRGFQPALLTISADEDDAWLIEAVQTAYRAARGRCPQPPLPAVWPPQEVL